MLAIRPAEPTSQEPPPPVPFFLQPPAARTVAQAPASRMLSFIDRNIEESPSRLFALHCKARTDSSRAMHAAGIALGLSASRMRTGTHGGAGPSHEGTTQHDRR